LAKLPPTSSRHPRRCARWEVLNSSALGTTVPVLAARAFRAGDLPRMNLVLRHELTLSFFFPDRFPGPTATPVAPRKHIG